MSAVLSYFMVALFAYVTGVLAGNSGVTPRAKPVQMIPPARLLIAFGKSTRKS